MLWNCALCLTLNVILNKIKSYTSNINQVEKKNLASYITPLTLQTPWSVLQFQAPERHLFFKVDRTQTVHHPEDSAAVEVKDVVKKHGVSVKEELVVVNVVIVTKCQPLHWISAKSKNSNPGFRIPEDQVFGDVEDLPAHIEVDNVCISLIGWLFISLFLIWGVEIVH